MKKSREKKEMKNVCIQFFLFKNRVTKIKLNVLSEAQQLHVTAQGIHSTLSHDFIFLMF